MALKPGPESQNEGIGCCGWTLMFLSLLLILVTLPLSIWCCIKIVREYERAVIFRLGKINRHGARGPGIYWIFPCIDDFRRIDLRTTAFVVPPQELLTKDSVTITVDAVLYYHIVDPIASVFKLDDVTLATQMLAQTTLRNILGLKNLSEILVEREEMAKQMELNLRDTTLEWGVKVEGVELKDVKLPENLQRAMAAEAEAAREAKAKVTAAEGEMQASRALKEAALVLSDTPAALQLRYLQTLNTISAEQNSTIVFPMPIDFLGALIRKGA
ncbi:erythrocyte band 7 integral membrane protein-like isoform X2 [Rhinatrema bivittatum]|uniref:erythrocyte band 7 integral membrane protein-like isoform X2 n=1 Tax=Rhinatrema bivittatum TaxID=194408 RepID=UPI001128BF49|nr:erythrocyte band 7 integral membrane protein-like isoform X2 [Rhinatrema bivittatum]